MKKLLVVVLCLALGFGSYQKAQAEPIQIFIIGGLLVSAIITTVYRYTKESDKEKEFNILLEKVKKSNLIINSEKINTDKFIKKISDNNKWQDYNNLSVLSVYPCCIITKKYSNFKTHVTEILYLQLFFKYDETKNESKIIRISNIQTGEVYSTVDGIDYVLNILYQYSNY
jgi:hypothetical protein